MNIETFYDPNTYTLTYVVYDEHSRDAIIIDPVLDFDPASGRIETKSVERLVEFVDALDLVVHWVLETHAHADHLSGSQYLKQRYKAGIVISDQITAVQEVFKGVFDLEPEFATDGRQFDKLVGDGEVLTAGSLELKVIHTPGHTPACVTYMTGDAIFTGDALFMDDYGTGRCDFPAGSAEMLYHSVHEKLYKLPDETRVFVGHDYQPNGRELRFETTIGASKEHNPQLTETTSAQQFITFRNERDATLNAPRLLFPSVQVNIRAGELPPAAANGNHYLKIPLRIVEPKVQVAEPHAGDEAGAAQARS